jgi:ribosomal protein S19E (S16A)
VLQFAFIAYFWIETKGMTLEQIEAKINAAVGMARAEVLYGDKVESQDEPEEEKKDSRAVVRQCEVA